jgi:hypothetical protein
MSKIIIVKTLEEGKIRARQERRENARLEKEGRPTKEVSTFKVQETRVLTSKAPPPKKKPVQIEKTNGLPARPLTNKEKEILRRTLMHSVEAVDEGKEVDLSKEVKDTTPTERINAEKLKERRKKALERRQNLKR